MKPQTKNALLAAAITAATLGVGSLVLQRWVAETRGAAIVLVIAWFVVVTIGAVFLLRSRSELRAPVFATLGAIAVATIAVGYWTGFRDQEVNEDVVVATSQASSSERADALEGAGEGGPAGGGAQVAKEKDEEPEGPVSLATGMFTGEDGHAGTGTAEIVQVPGGVRTLTFTKFDVDPGVDVDVYLTPDTKDISDRVELGGLKGNVGDQQYDIPAEADLSKYDSVILWCTPFTVRIAVAALRAPDAESA